MNTGKERINVARMKRQGKTFEVVIEPKEALMYRKGQLDDVRDALRDEHVFVDAKKGLVASEEDIKSLFDVSSSLEAAARIIKEGELQLTEDIREGMRAQRVRAIINEVHRFGVDPRTNAPHPLARIEAAFEQAKVKIDETRGAQEQLSDVLKQLNHLLPIKVSVKTIQVHIPATSANKCLPKLKQYGTLKKQQWQPDGSLIGEVEMPGGLEADFYDMLNKLTSGQAEAKVVN